MKQLLIRADDLGYSDGVNYGIAKAVNKGVVKSVGVMTNMPTAMDGLKLLKKENVCLGQHTNICVGNHVWLSAYTHILKNSSIPDGSVVAYHSVVMKKFEGEKLLIGGYPAKIISDCVEWKR